MLLVRLGLLLASFGFASILPADDKKPEELDPVKLIGTWKIVEGTKAGEKSDLEMLKAGRATINKETITFSDGENKFVFGYKLDLKKSPVTIDLVILEPDALKDAKAPGIIKLEGGKLTLAYHPSGGSRPEKFESTADNGVYLFVHELVTEEKK